MDCFLSCDWGTSSFRIRLVDSRNSEVLKEEKSNQGIAAAFSFWRESGNLTEDRKAPFYLNIVQKHIGIIEEKIGYSLAEVKVILSGMASSSIGLIEIPYSLAPIPVDGIGIKTALIPADNNFLHDTLVISGVQTGNDVMRGEETQLIGCIDSGSFVKNEIYIFPGTHSKHVRIRNNQIENIKTYMTGEFFELLSQKSILKSAVEINHQTDRTVDLTSFKSGVRDSLSSNILNAAFKVRINQLFNLTTKPENFDYLSGLLIGTELNDLKQANAEVIDLVCGSGLNIYYETAMQVMEISNVNFFPPEWVDEAVVRGQYRIAKQQNFLA